MIPALCALMLAATATAGVKTARVEVGEHVPITVRVTARPGAIVTLYPPASQPPSFEVPESAPRLLQADGAGNVVFTFEVIPWADGDAQIPAARVDVAGSGTVSTNAVALKPFNPLGPKAKDAKPQDIREIRPFPTPFPAWVWVLLGVMLGMGLWLAVRRKKPAASPALEPVRGGPIAPTLGDAIDAVRRIAEKPPRDRAGIREAHFVVAEAVRLFVEERWEVPASRQTTEEFLSAVTARGDSGRFGPGTGMLPAILEACDRVKWAGDAVGPDDTVQLARTALELFAASRAAIRGLGGPDAGLAVERRS